MPKLIVTPHDGPAMPHELVEPVVTVGRLSDNTIVIDDGSVSSHHAQLRIEGGDYHLKDLNSTNGTRVNGNTISEQQLQDGDVVRFGKVEAKYESEIPAPTRPLPESDRASGTAASASHRPADFDNASPFKGKRRGTDPAAAAVIALAVIAFLAFAGSVATIFQIKPQ
jgi:predicted component of type VI protein secretion system